MEMPETEAALERQEGEEDICPQTEPVCEPEAAEETGVSEAFLLECHRLLDRLEGLCGTQQRKAEAEQAGAAEHADILERISGLGQTQQQTAESVAAAASALERGNRELSEFHREQINFMRIQDRMQEELEKHRSGLYRQLLDPVLAAIAQIYSDYVGNVARIEDTRVKNGFAYMFDDLLDLLADHGVETYKSEPGVQVSKRFCRIRGKAPTDDPALHGAVARSHNTGFHIGPRVLVYENVDVYILNDAQPAGTGLPENAGDDGEAKEPCTGDSSAGFEA